MFKIVVTAHLQRREKSKRLTSGPELLTPQPKIKSMQYSVPNLQRKRSGRHCICCHYSLAVPINRATTPTVWSLPSNDKLLYADTISPISGSGSLAFSEAFRDGQIPSISRIHHILSLN